ncbi:MAG: hypothetical protein IRZ32_00295 [Solirubrobacteraceae bacterium]|nr:hypothetical protein [Solirubrobacteraceae bacterium]
MTYASTRIVGALTTLLLAAAAPAAAHAQDGTPEPVPADAQPAAGGISLLAQDARAALRLDFRSDRATCRRVGRCGLRGRVRHRSGGVGGAFVVTMGDLVAGGGGLYDPAGRTVARVRDRGQRCRDRIAHTVTTFGVRRSGDAVEVVFLSPAAAAGAEIEGSEDPLSTRCAGPRLADLQATGSLPVATTTLDALRAGPVTLTASGTRRLRSAGMRGTLRYDVTVTVSPAPLGAEPGPDTPLARLARECQDC